MRTRLVFLPQINMERWRWTSRCLEQEKLRQKCLVQVFSVVSTWWGCLRLSHTELRLCARSILLFAHLTQRRWMRYLFCLQIHYYLS